MDLIVPFPNLSCSTISPSIKSEESLPINGTSDLLLVLNIFLNLSSFTYGLGSSRSDVALPWETLFVEKAYLRFVDNAEISDQSP